MLGLIIGDYVTYAESRAGGSPGIRSRGGPGRVGCASFRRTEWIPEMSEGRLQRTREAYTDTGVVADAQGPRNWVDLKPGELVLGMTYRPRVWVTPADTATPNAALEAYQELLIANQRFISKWGAGY